MPKETLLCVMMSDMKKLAIIGGGAAGLAAAIAAADELRAGTAMPGAKVDSHGVEIVVYEADERVGRSILATGNGRCNFSNAQVDASLYRNAEFVAAAFGALDAYGTGADGPLEMLNVKSEKCDADNADDCNSGADNAGTDNADTGNFDAHNTGTCNAEAYNVCSSTNYNPVLSFFANLGLMWREEVEGRLYPLANKASSVLDVLRVAARSRGVKEVCDRRAVRIDLPQHTGERLHVRFADGAVEHAQTVIVAVGGHGISELMDGLATCAPTQPVLGPLRTKETVVKQLNNIRVRCAVSLCDPNGALKAREVGEVLFRDYGVSGIAVFNLSRVAAPGDMLSIDFLPAYDAAACDTLFEDRLDCLTVNGCAPTGEDFLRGMLLPSVTRVVLHSVDIAPDHPVSAEDIPALIQALKRFRLTVAGIGDVRQCQVNRGGVDVGEVDASTMELCQVKDLFVTGEALDVDGPCGGFNLHWAWASGILAGRSAAQCLLREELHA